MRVSISEIRSFLTCRQEWEYTSPNRLNLQPKADKVNKAFLLGGWIHVALEHFYRSDANPLDTLESEVAKYTDAVYEKGHTSEEWEETVQECHELARGMLENYIGYWGKHAKYDRDGIQVLATELQFEVPIPGFEDAYFVGTVDGLLADAHGDYWVLEHKTYSSETPIPILMMNQQQVAYVAAMRALQADGQLRKYGVRESPQIAGVLWNGMLKKVPGKYRGKEPFFSRQWIERSDLEATLFWFRLQQIYRAMTGPDIYPTPNEACVRCPFYDPCRAAQTGEDEDWLLAAHYVQRPPRGAVYTQVDSEDASA